MLYNVMQYAFVFIFFQLIKRQYCYNILNFPTNSLKICTIIISVIIF